MNKTLLVFFAGMLILAPGCSEKKNRLAANTLTITLDPSQTTMLMPLDTLPLTALCQSSKSDSVDISPTWVLDNAALGNFTAATGKTTVFNVARAGGTGTIRAEYGDIRSAALPISVGVLYADAGCYNKLVFSGANGDAFSYFDGGDGSPDADPWRIAIVKAIPGCAVDAGEALKVTYTASGSSYGGIFLTFASPTNMSLYSKLTFYAKGEIGSESFLIGIRDSDGDEQSISSPTSDIPALTTSWQKVEIPLTKFTTLKPTLNTAAIDKPFILTFSGTGNATIYIDRIAFE